MRRQLFYNPRILCERLAIESQRLRRLGNLKGTVAGNLKLGHINSLELLEMLGSSASSPKVVFDLGASTGTWSLLAKALLPKATIHAFEPLQSHYLKLEQATSRVAGIHLHQIAVGSYTGQTKMHVASFSDASSLLAFGRRTRDEFGITEVDQTEVTVSTLDGYVQKQELPLPDLIKLDLQGYEVEALLGGEVCLRHATSLVCEVSFVEYYEDQPLFHDVVTFLADRGFHIRAFGVGTPIGESLSQADALFVRTQEH